MKVTLFLLIATAILQLACSMPSAQGESTAVATDRKGWWSDFWETITNPKKLWNVLKSAFNKIGEFFSNAWEAFKDKISEIANGVKDFFVNVYNKFKDGDILGAFGDIWNGIKSVVNFVLNPMDMFIDIAIQAFFKTVAPDLAKLYKEEDNGDETVDDVKEKSEQIMEDGTRELSSYKTTINKEMEEAKKSDDPSVKNCVIRHGIIFVKYGKEDIDHLKGCTTKPYHTIKDTIKLIKDIIKDIKTLFSDVKNRYKLCKLIPAMPAALVCYGAIIAVSIPPVVKLIDKAINDVPEMIQRWKEQFKVLQECTPNWVGEVKKKWTKAIGDFKKECLRQ